MQRWQSIARPRIPRRTRLTVKLAVPAPHRPRRPTFSRAARPRLAKAYWVHDSPGYQAALKAFNNAAERDFRIVEGLA